ncbi:MAG: replication restart helicase PriA [Thermoanaerobaculum sp.]
MFVRVVFPLAVPEALTYRVPSRWLGHVQPGMRVVAPLRGKPRVGLVFEEDPEPPVAPERIVELAEILDPEPLVPAHVLALVRFASDYYVCPPGLVAKSALPPKLMRLPPARLELGPRAVELLPTFSGTARELVSLLLARRRLSLASLRAHGFEPGELRELLPALEERAVLRVVQPQPLREAGRVVSVLTLADGSWMAAEGVRSPKQKHLLEELHRRGGLAVESQILEELGFSRAVSDALVQRGVLRRFQQLRQATPQRWELPPSPVPQTLSPAQEAALRRLHAAVTTCAYRAFLLLGVTGSGKTEVYLRAVQTVVEGGGQALILVPEIGLTPKVAGELAARFGSRVAVLHSSLPEGERFALWEKARRGEVDVVAGPRSALWAPLARLRLIVVDEEQDPSYKQEEDPRYNARDLALVLGQKLSIPVLLASATPALETVWLARQGKLSVLELPERVSGDHLPEVEVVDLTKAPPEPGEHGRRYFSPRLLELLEGTLARGEQAILLVNRRGWAPVLLCRDCGHTMPCRDCAIPLTLHRRPPRLVCHYCGYSTEPPATCPRCGGGLLEDVGAGTEKIAAKLKSRFPGAHVGILDRDTARTPAKLMATLERFAQGEIQVLVGTQMVSKGHHFPGVTLTAVVNADNLLGFPDFRGAERTFQLLTQVAGRAGRGEKPGRVVIQTYHPNHYAIAAAAEHDVTRFVEGELAYRKAFRYPPFYRMALVRFESARETQAIKAAEQAARAVPSLPGLRLVGPTAAPIARLRGRFRVHFMLLAQNRGALRQALSAVAGTKFPSAVRRIVDVDPLSTV